MDQDLIILNEKLEEEKEKYCDNLTKFREEIKRLKVASRGGFGGSGCGGGGGDGGDGGEGFDFREKCRSGLRFILEMFQTIILMQENIEVDKVTQN